MASDLAPRARPQRVSLADGVHEILLAQLIDGTIPADTALNIDQLARDLSVSQTPIREALARLESTGLIHRAALRGYRVAPLFTDRELSDLMDARAVIEPVNAYLAAGRVTAAFTAQLGETVSMLQSYDGSRDYHQYWAADERFHRLISEHSDNRFLQGAFDSLGGHVQRFRLFGVLGVTDAEHAAREHTVILAAFGGGDPTGAREAMAEHIANVKQRTHSDREALPH